MHGVVSLLDAQHYQAVESLWAELAATCGLRGVYVTPFPHFSYHVAAEYDLLALETVLRDFACRQAPFRVTATGLGIFTGVSPVVYIPVVRDPALTAFHQALWPRFAASPATAAPTTRLRPGCRISLSSSATLPPPTCRMCCGCWAPAPSTGISRSITWRSSTTAAPGKRCERVSIWVARHNQPRIEWARRLRKERGASVHRPPKGTLWRRLVRRPPAQSRCRARAAASKSARKSGCAMAMSAAARWCTVLPNR